MKKKSTLTTAIIVNFNSGSLLSSCVQSLLASDVPLNIVIIDNNSEDDSLSRTEDLFGDHHNLRFIKNIKNMGFAHACNQGIELDTCKYWLFINPDCVVAPDSLSQMESFMDANLGVAMSGPLIVNPDGTEQRGCRRTVPTPWRSFIRAFGLSHFSLKSEKLQDFLLNKEPLPSKPVDVEAISGAFMFVRRSVTEEVGLLDEGYFLHCEDLDWCMRFRQAGWKIQFVPHVKIMHVKGGCSASRYVFVHWNMHKGMIRFYTKFFKKRYSGFLMWLVVLAVWFRFFSLTFLHFIKKALSPFQIIKTKIHARKTRSDT